MKTKTDLELIGADPMLFVSKCEAKALAYFVFLILTFRYCLGKAINVTDFGNSDIKIPPKNDHQTHAYAWNGSRNSGDEAIGKSFNNDISQTDVNAIDIKNIPVNTSKNTGLTTEEPHSELPLPILIASPVAALSIVLFICIAYKWHSIQLDEQAKKIVIERVASQSETSSPGRVTQRLVPPGHGRADCDLTGGKRRSLRTPTPPPSISRSRASLWSADQEVLTHAHASPRRHSTFIL